MPRVRYDSVALQEDLSGKTIQFLNAKVLREGRIEWDHVWVRDGKIIDAASVFFDERRSADVQVDCQGLIISPGFIDIQINGGFGVDFSTMPSSDEEYRNAVDEVSLRLLSHGVTSFVPTIISSPPEVYARVLPLLARRNGSEKGAGILAALDLDNKENCISCAKKICQHLVDGPFISRDKKGCHPKQHIRDFCSDAVLSIKKVYGSMENVAIVTLAPELDGSEEAIRIASAVTQLPFPRLTQYIAADSAETLRESMNANRLIADAILYAYGTEGYRYLSEQGIVVSIGHSSARLKNGEQGFKMGAKCITHLFNAMQPYHHRDPCLIGLLASRMFENRTIYYGMISDGVHTHDSALRIAYRTNPEGLILITDAIAALGMGDGQHRLGDVVINVTGLEAIVEGTNVPAGSVASMPYCVRHLVKAACCSLEEALACATVKPATLLGIQNQKGVIAVDADADIVLISENVDVHATYVSGKLVYANSW